MKESTEQGISKQLARITEILEDIFIFQASIAQIKKKSVRAMVGVGTDRVSRISMYVKSRENTGRNGE
jgi:3-deoxy-D-manno-octulosonic acid (KDO) 8-phosphate synthase